jgi:hypothetical protein
LSISSFNKNRTLCCKYCVKSGIIFERFSVFIVEALIVGLNLKKKALDTYQKLRIGVESEANLALKGYLNDSVSITALIDVYQEKRDVELDYVKALKDYQESLLKYDDKLDRVLTRY